jgi:hypothetical protein
MAQRVLDLLILDQPCARVLPGLVVEHLPVEPVVRIEPSPINEARRIDVQTSARRRPRVRPRIRSASPAAASGAGAVLVTAPIVLRDAPADVTSKG